MGSERHALFNAGRVFLYLERMMTFINESKSNVL